MRRLSGFTLIEQMFTMSLVAIGLSIAVPSFARLNADTRARITAEELAGALRLAQVSAVTHNRTAVFELTNAVPTYDAAAVPDGSNWLVKVLPSAIASEAATGKDLIKVATFARQNGVTLTGPALVCFDPIGVQVATPAAAAGLSAACAPPGGSLGSPTSYMVSRVGATRQFRVLVYRAGRVHVCESGRQNGTTPDECP